MSDIICLFCNKSYSQKVSLNKHLINCKAAILSNPLEIQKFIISYTQRAIDMRLSNIEEIVEEPVEEPLKEIIEEPLKEIIEEPLKEIIEEPLKEIIEEPVEREQELQLKFDGIFKGREKEIRITHDKQVSVFDFIKVVGGQTQPRKTWLDIKKTHKDEVVTFCNDFKFEGSGQRLTPVVNVQGMVKLLFWLPGETAKQFRSKSA